MSRINGLQTHENGSYGMRSCNMERYGATREHTHWKNLGKVEHGHIGFVPARSRPGGGGGGSVRPPPKLSMSTLQRSDFGRGFDSHRLHQQNYGAAKVSTGSTNCNLMPGMVLTVTRAKQQRPILTNCLRRPKQPSEPAGSLGTESRQISWKSEGVMRTETVLDAEDLLRRLRLAIKMINELESEQRIGDSMIQIKKSPTADTRTCDFANTSKEALLASSHQHIEDVGKGIQWFRLMLHEAANVHDHDKISDIDGFHRDFVTGFTRTEWWDNHRKVNRHHLLQPDGVPQDVNLIDVLDMIADCVMAGMARSGSVYPLNIDPQVLMNAFQNTVEVLKSKVEVKG